MSATIAMAPSPAPYDRLPFSSGSLPAAKSSGPATSPTASRSGPAPSATAASSSNSTPRSGTTSPKGPPAPASKPSPPAARNGALPPKIVVKKEPGSPEPPTARHRPRRLDLSKNTLHAGSGAQTARPLTTAERGNLGIQEVGIACLSPGFMTQDPVLKEQLQRSMSVRDQQRHIIESRLQQQSAKTSDGNMDGPAGSKDAKDSTSFVAKTPGMSSRRNKAGLAIVAPSHEQFANERVIQSAPLHQTFTGRHDPHPLTRHITNQPSNLSRLSHIHNVPPPGQSNDRDRERNSNQLPSISNIFGQVNSAHPDSSSQTRGSAFFNSSHAPLSSPGHPPPHYQAHGSSSHPHAPPPSSRPREFSSAEEAQHELAGGRPELLPKLVHYGGHQPPTPPSPVNGASSRHQNHGHLPDPSRSATKRRRDEFEAGGSPPLGNGPPTSRPRMPYPESTSGAAGRDSPEAARRKRERFLRLCEEAWDLLHS